MLNTYYLMALLNLGLCLAVITISIIRLNCSQRKRARLKYTAVLLATLVAAFQPYFFDKFPGLGCLTLAGSVLWLLIDGASSFRKYKNADYCFYDTQLFDPENHGE